MHDVTRTVVAKVRPDLAPVAAQRLRDMALQGFFNEQAVSFFRVNEVGASRHL
jgi:hypothetical protein